MASHPEKPLPATACLHIRHRLCNLTVTVGCGRRGPLLLATAFGLHGRLQNAQDAALARAAAAWAGLLRRHLDTGAVDLSLIPLALDGFSPFRKSVLAAARRIPAGETTSYAELARLAGAPGAVRAAASVMRHNPFVLVVPCHRVLRSDGSIGGFMGSTAGASIVLKRRLLALEAAART